MRIAICNPGEIHVYISGHKIQGYIYFTPWKSTGFRGRKSCSSSWWVFTIIIIIIIIIIETPISCGSKHQTYRTHPWGKPTAADCRWWSSTVRKIPPAAWRTTCVPPRGPTNRSLGFLLKKFERNGDPKKGGWGGKVVVEQNNTKI